MALEQWQKHLKSQPCDVCGGYGAYKEEKRCKGFRTADGLGTFCSSTPNGRSPKDFGGYDLYYHPKSEGEGEVESRGLKYKQGLYIWKGRLRRQAREAETRRPPTARDFG